MEKILSEIDYQTILYTGTENRKWLMKKSAMLSGTIFRQEKDFCFVYTYPGVFNYLLNARFTAQSAERIIQKIRMKIKEGMYPKKRVLDPLSKPDNLDQMLKKNNFYLLFNSSAMAMKTGDISDYNIRKNDMKIERIEKKSQLIQWIGVVGKELWKMNESACQNAISFFNSMLSEENIRLYVGELNGIPVATGGLVLAEGIAGLYFISTEKSYRSRGFGSAMTNFLLEQAKKAGYQIGWLFATELGERIYKKIGFKTYYQFQTFEYSE